MLVLVKYDLGLPSYNPGQAAWANNGKNPKLIGYSSPGDYELCTS